MKKTRGIRAVLDAEKHGLEGMVLLHYQRDYAEFLRYVAARGYENFALKETWSPADTELFNAQYSMVVNKPNLSTQELLEKLPSLSALPFSGRTWSKSKSRGRLAMVGNALCNDGRNLGPWIDSHEWVVRFNRFKRDRKTDKKKDWGFKVDAHVANIYADWCCTRSVPLYDLEVESFEGKQVWYRRLFHKSTKPVFFVRPSVRPNFAQAGFSRGLLFFLLAGRYFRHVDILGFSGNPSPSGDELQEEALLFETTLWRALNSTSMALFADLPPAFDGWHYQLRKHSRTVPQITKTNHTGPMLFNIDDIGP